MLDMCSTVLRSVFVMFLFLTRNPKKLYSGMVIESPHNFTLSHQQGYLICHLFPISNTNVSVMNLAG